MSLERRAVSSQIPTSSMADIAFLLVIYFMLTMTFAANQGLDLGLPGEAPKEIDPVEAVSVIVEKSGLLRVDHRPMALSGLLAYLEPKLRRDPAKPVIVQAGEGTSYATVVHVLDELRQGKDRLGLEREIDVALPTEREVRLYGIGVNRAER